MLILNYLLNSKVFTIFLWFLVKAFKIIHISLQLYILLTFYANYLYQFIFAAIS